MITEGGITANNLPLQMNINHTMDSSPPIPGFPCSPGSPHRSLSSLDSPGPSIRPLNSFVPSIPFPSFPRSLHCSGPSILPLVPQSPEPCAHNFPVAPSLNSPVLSVPLFSSQLFPLPTLHVLAPFIHRLYEFPQSPSSLSAELQVVGFLASSLVLLDRRF